MNSEYKQYSLENIKTWIQDALSSGGALPEEIFNTIKEAVREEYYIYKDSASKCHELLALLNGNGKGHLICDKDDTSEECKGAWDSFWEEHYYPEEVKVDDGMRPWGHSDLEYMIANPTLTEDRISNFPGEQYTEEELNAMCDKAASDEEKEKCREYNLREAEYYNKQTELDFNNQISRNDSTRLEYKEGFVYESPDGGKTVYARKPGETERTLVKEEKINKWVLPVGVDGLTGDCFVNLPDDLLELANLKEGDEVEWVEKKDGTYILRKSIKPLGPDEC